MRKHFRTAVATHSKWCTVKRANEGMAKKAVDDITVFEGIQRPTLGELAYHEAGHAVVALHLKIPFRFVTIVPSEVEKRLGQLRLEGKRRNGVKPSQEVEDRMVLLVSGPIAAGIWAEKRRGLSLLNLNELLEVLDICEELWPVLLPGKVPEDVMVRVLDRSKRILDLHWTEVRPIANALLKERTLSKRRVLGLLED